MSILTTIIGIYFFVIYLRYNIGAHDKALLLRSYPTILYSIIVLYIYIMYIDNFITNPEYAVPVFIPTTKQSLNRRMLADCDTGLVFECIIRKISS